MNLKKTMVGINSTRNNIKHFLTYLIIIAPLSSFANDFPGKNLICSTKSYPIKGGFEFTNRSEVNKFNILVNDNGLKSIKRTSHCYRILEGRILISDKSATYGCGSYSSYIDMFSLIYNIPTNEIILSATCKFYNGNLAMMLEKSIRE